MVHGTLSSTTLKLAFVSLGEKKIGDARLGKEHVCAVSFIGIFWGCHQEKTWN